MSIPTAAAYAAAIHSEGGWATGRSSGIMSRKDIQCHMQKDYACRMLMKKGFTL